MSKKNKRKKWIKPRHKVVRNILGAFLTPYCAVKYGIKVEKFKNPEKSPYLILFNHQTAFDQFFVGAAFKDPIYYMATEDIFSNGWVSSLIKYLVEPIPIKKQTTDLKAIMTCIRVAKEGGTIAIAPEGNRTYSGKTVYMSPSIAPLAKKLGMPIALFRIEGGYGVQPRWSDVVRKGKMKAYVSRVITPDEYKNMSDDELFDIIKSELDINEAVADGKFTHKKLAERLERSMYFCPDCGLSTFESKNDIISCKKCSKQIRYLQTKELEGVGFDFPYHFVLDWYEAQEKYVNSLDLEACGDTLFYDEKILEMREVIPYERKKLISSNAKIKLYGNRAELEFDGKAMVCRFDDASTVTVLGKNKLNIYIDGKIYQIKGDEHFNSLKYVHFYTRYKNIVKGEAYVQFLGL